MRSLFVLFNRTNALGFLVLFCIAMSEIGCIVYCDSIHLGWLEIDWKQIKHLESTE